MMFLLTCDKKLTKSQLSPTHASTKRKITDELKHNAGWYEVREGSPVEVQWAELMCVNLPVVDVLKPEPIRVSNTYELFQDDF